MPRAGPTTLVESRRARAAAAALKHYPPPSARRGWEDEDARRFKEDLERTDDVPAVAYDRLAAALALVPGKRRHR